MYTYLLYQFLQRHVFNQNIVLRGKILETQNRTNIYSICTSIFMTCRKRAYLIKLFQYIEKDHSSFIINILLYPNYIILFCLKDIY